MTVFRYLVFFLIIFNSLFGAFLFQKDTANTYVEEEEVYLSFRYQGVIDEIVVAYYSQDQFFLPLTELFDLFAINYELSPASLSINGFFIKENTKYIMDFNRRFAMVNDEVFSISANEFLVKEVDFFVAPSVFKEVFGLDLTVDISRLTLRLETKHILPVVARYNRRYREQLRERYSNTDTGEIYPLVSGRDYRLIDGALMDYSLYSSVSADNRFMNINLNLGGEVFYGDLQGTSITSFANGSPSFSGSDIRWRYAQDDYRWFSTVTLGQQGGSGLSSQTLQGIRVTNQPLVPRRSYDSYSIEGTTEPEAEVELYQNDHLVEVIHADDVGYYRFLVPLNYGTSDFKIRIYAKQGRVIELDRRVQIPFNFLPVGEIRYDLSAGRLALAERLWRNQSEVAAGNVMMGVKNWLTAGLGVEYIEDNNRDKPVFYSKISSRIAGDVLLGLDAVFKNYYTLSVRGVGPNTSSMSMDYTFFSQTNMYNSLGYRHRLSTNVFYPFFLGSQRFTARGNTGWINLPGENRFSVNVDINQFIRELRLRYGIREQHAFGSSGHTVASEFQTGVVYTIPRVPSVHPLLRGSYFRADIGLNTVLGQIENLKFQYIKQFTSRLKAQFLSTYNLIRHDAFFELGVTWDLETIRTSSTIRSIRALPSYTQTLRGSVGLDRYNHEFIWDNRQQVGRSAVSVRMFIDDDNSGTYDEGEEIIPGNALTIEHASSRQIEKNGISRFTQLQPYRHYNFRVNEARVNNPMLMASKPKFSIITDPNQYKQLDVPFYTTGVIDGRVDRIKHGEFIPVSGLRIHVKSEDGNYEETLRTFADGSFYSMEIPPGSYELWVDESQLEFLQMNSIPEKLYFTIKPSAEGDFVENLDFLLE